MRHQLIEHDRWEACGVRQGSSIIELFHVSWVRDDQVILHDINWSIGAGEHWAVMGRNGSGKTTLMNLISGYLWPSQGSIHVFGKEFGQVDLRELRKSIGWVSSHLQEQVPPRDTGLKIVLSGKEASFGFYREPNNQEMLQAKAIMDKLGCSHLSERQYQTCSQGEKQKLLIGRALMASPRLMILDEPCSGLDLLAREQLLHTIQQMAEADEGPTLIYVTHYIEEILPCFRHALLMSDGRVYFSGKTEEAFQTDRMTNFLGMPVQVEWRNQRAWVTLTEVGRRWSD